MLGHLRSRRDTIIFLLLPNYFHRF